MKFITALALILSLSCHYKAKDNSEDFFDTIYAKLISTTEISYLDRKLINSNVEISSPSNTWLTLFDLKTIRTGSWAEENYCLFYKVPYHEYLNKINLYQNVKKVDWLPENFGSLKITKLEVGKTCQDIITKDGIKELKYILGLKGFFSRDKKELELHLRYINPENLRQKTLTLIVPFYNLLPGRIVGDENYLNESYTENVIGSSSASKTLIKGLRIQGLSSIEDLSIDKNQMLGKIDDSYEKHNLIKCHELNESCEVVQHFRCDHCRYGWFEVVGGKCPGIKDKYCGQGRCGEKNMPACPRGQLYNQFDSNLNCATDSTTGFCRRGLKTVCDSNVLICL